MPGADVPACHDTGTKHHKQGTIRTTLHNSSRRVLIYSKQHQMIGHTIVLHLIATCFGLELDHHQARYSH